MYLKFIVFTVSFGITLCQYGDFGTVYYQLPDNETTKSLNVTIKSESYEHFQITVECYNYNSLKYFEVRLGESKEFELRNGIFLNFVKCFNSATDNENNKYGLARWFSSLPYFNSGNHNGYPIIIKLDEYSEVNSDALFKNFDFRKFDKVSFINLGFKITNFFKNLYCQSCEFENNGNINFNDYGNSINGTNRLQLKFNKLTNLNHDNLKKFIALKKFDTSDFELEDINAFNVPDLFGNNVNITELIMERSRVKIILHENVFRGLKKLQRIFLSNLQLDNIPKNLFKDLEALGAVYLSSNNIKKLDSTTFSNNKLLSFASFRDNPFYTEPHDELEAFDFHSALNTLELGNFSVHTFDLLKQLIKNPDLRLVRFQKFLVENFNITEFIKISSSRLSVLNVDFRSGQPIVDLAYVKSFGNIVRSKFDLKSNSFNIFIHTQFYGDAMCHDCAMIKYLFPHFLRHYRNHPGLYFEESGIFIEFKIPESCNHLEEHFEEKFEKNCPSNCTCKFSPLLDKVKINCINRNLTEIPYIPYPTQFDKLDSMDLSFENNSIGILSLDNQDANVLNKLSTFNFKNNKIFTQAINDTVLASNIRALNLCGNPIVNSSERLLVLTLASGYKHFNQFNCFTNNVYPPVVNYIEGHKSSELNGFLNNLNCN